jgi:hypothetical protein
VLVRELSSGARLVLVTALSAGAWLILLFALSAGACIRPGVTRSAAVGCAAGGSGIESVWFF